MWRQLFQSWLRNEVSRRAKDAARQSSPSTATDAAPRDAPPVHAAIVFALKIEAGGLLDAMRGVVVERADGLMVYDGALAKRRVQVVLSGVGRQRAAAATGALIAAHHPGWVISSGLAGGLVPEIAREDIVVADSLADGRSGARLQIDVQMQPTANLHVGRLVTVDRIAKTSREKSALAAQHDAIAVDLESFAVAEICRREKTRFLCVRAISDTLDDRLPSDIENLMNQRTWPGRLGAVTTSIFRRPASVKDMWRLHETAVGASERLAKFLTKLVAELP